MAKDFTPKTIKRIGIISEVEYDRTNYTTKKQEHVKKTREIRIVAWGNNEPKLDIRDWLEVNGVPDATTEKVATWDEEQLAKLRFLLDQMDEAV